MCKNINSLYCSQASNLSLWLNFIAIFEVFYLNFEHCENFSDLFDFSDANVSVISVFIQEIFDMHKF